MANKNNRKHTLIGGRASPKAIFQRGKAFYIQVSNRESIIKLFHHMYDDSSVFMERKFMPFKEFLYKI